MCTIRKQVILLAITGSLALAQTPGYFKDMFSDGGVYLNAMGYMFAAGNLGLSAEYLSTDDKETQNAVMVSNEFDSNGHLLYPDGAPRFRIIYTNGGKSSSHGTSLGETGRERVRTFYRNGGSFSGSCAGAFIASLHYEPIGLNESYYHIWPGRTESTHLLSSATGHFIPADSPLLNYYDFGQDLYIDDIAHNGGCYANEDQFSIPVETEILLRFDYPLLAMHGKASCWAYKSNDIRGRIVVIGSHPEKEVFGEGLQLMEAMLAYALEGCGTPQIKAILNRGETRVMNRATEDNDPGSTKIGDKQYHHFKFEIPIDANNISITLDANDEYDFNLYLNPDTLAFEGNSIYESTDAGADHNIMVASPNYQTWYVGVECASTVEANGISYSGNLDVLNGVAYSITATWGTLGSASPNEPALPLASDLHQNYPNPFNPSTTIRYSLAEHSEVSVSIFDVTGRPINRIVESQQATGNYNILWNGTDDQGLGVPTGVYFCRLEAGSFSETIKMLYLR